MPYRRGRRDSALNYLARARQNQFTKFLALLTEDVTPDAERLVIDTHCEPAIQEILLDAIKEMGEEIGEEEIGESGYSDLAQGFLVAAIRAMGDVFHEITPQNQQLPLDLRPTQPPPPVRDLHLLVVLLQLRNILNGLPQGSQWFQQLVLLRPNDCDLVVRGCADMAPEEMADLMQSALELPEGPGELSVILAEGQLDARDQLRDLERDDRREAMLLWNGADALSAAKFHAEPEMKVLGESTVSNMQLKEEKVLYNDRQSERLGIRPRETVALDTSMMGMDSRKKVSSHVTQLGNTEECYHALHKNKKDLLRKRVERDEAKARWWAGFAKEQPKRAVIAKLRGIRESVRLRQREATRVREDEERAAELRQRAAEKKKSKAQMILEALNAADKWTSEEGRSTKKALRERTLMSNLAAAAPDTDVPHKVRQKDGRSCELKEWDSDGVPVTAKAAAHTFGTAAYEEKDYSAEVKDWKVSGTLREGCLENRRQLRQEMRDYSKDAAFQERCNNWRAQAAQVEQARQDRLAREALAKLRAAEEKARLRAEAKERRRLMLEKAKKEAEELARRNALADSRKAQELEQERLARMSMAVEEAKQCAVDRFWGVLTEWERLNRLERMKRLIWEARISETRGWTVQVGVTDADTAKESRRIRLQKDLALGGLDEFQGRRVEA